MTNTPTAPLDADVTQALEPFLCEFDRLEREYGFDRPDHQGQCLMICMSDIKRLRAAVLASTQGSQGREADGFAAGIEAAALVVEDGYRCRTCDVVFLARDGHPSPKCAYPNWDALTDDQKIEAIRALAPVREAEAISTASEGDGIVAGEHMYCPWCHYPAIVVKSRESSTWRAGCNQVGACPVLPYCVGESIAEAWAMWDAASPKVASDTAPGVRAKLEYRNMGSGGRCDWQQLREAVSEACCGSREALEHFDPGYYHGHQMVKGINYNSLDRIVTAFVDAALSASPSDSVGGVEGAIEVDR